MGLKIILFWIEFEMISNFGEYDMFKYMVKLFFFWWNIAGSLYTHIIGPWYIRKKKLLVQKKKVKFNDIIWHLPYQFEITYCTV